MLSLFSLPIQTQSPEVWALTYVSLSSTLGKAMLTLIPQPAQIGQALSIMGFISIFLKLSMTVILRPDRPHALTWLFNLTMSSWVLTFLAFPFLSWVVALSENSSQGLLDEDTTLTIMGRKAVWFAASFVLLLSRIGCMAFTYVNTRLDDNHLLMSFVDWF